MEELKDIFGSDGLFAREFSGYEYRKAQVAMANLVAKSLSETKHALIEAGTGVGKTFAYIIPFLLAKQKCIISTATKNLQGQLIYKDLPALQKIWHEPFTYMMLKGRNNYLCLSCFNNLYASLGFSIDWDERLEPQVDKLSKWVDKTETGDLEELGFVLLPELREEVQSRRAFCNGSSCDNLKDCYLLKARRRAMTSDIVVVNHHLLLAELTLLAATETSNLPAHPTLILDEAHTIEDIATNYFGYFFGNTSLNTFLNSMRKAIKEERIKGEATPYISRSIAVVLESKFWRIFEKIDTRRSLEKGEGMRIYARKETLELKDLLEGIAEALKTCDFKEDFLTELNSFPASLDFILSQEREDEFCYLIERYKDIIELQALPIDISPLLPESVYKRFNTLIMTSATLTVDKSFDYLKGRIGFRPHLEMISESPFPYSKNAMLYVPKTFPEPSSEDFPRYVAETIDIIARAADGRTLCLFTSIKNMNDVYSRIKAKNLPYTLLLQGEFPRDVLIKKFRGEETSILFGVTSFWQGIDVIGPSLRAVIIDKLPFPSPGEPLVDARSRRIERLGGSWFKDYSLPQAIMLLRQGAGRLIRSNTDWGIVAVLDIRLHTKFYGKHVLDSLPAFIRTDKLEDVLRFFDDFTNRGTEEETEKKRHKVRAPRKKAKREDRK